MSTEIKKLENGNFSIAEIWEKPEKIKKLFAPMLTNDEFAYFMGLSKLSEANPFRGEIWAVKYEKTKPAAVFLGRNFFRKIALGQPTYDYHCSDAIYENDTFEVENGIPRHGYNLKDRGKLLGAYAIAKRTESTQANFVFVNLKDYDKNQSTWKSMPHVMICKVAEATVLRMTWYDKLGNAYDESEQASFERKKIKAMPRSIFAALPEGKTEKEQMDNEWKMTEKLEADLVSAASKADIDLNGLRNYLKSNNLPDISQLNEDQYNAALTDFQSR